MSEPPMIQPRDIDDRAVLRYRAGDLLIDMGRQQVTREGASIALPRLSFILLTALVRAAPNLVTTEALMERVWPKAVVGPETLNQRVKLLRDALGDDPRHPRYVEGLRGRGYRWIPSVETLDPAIAAAPQPSVPATTGLAADRNAPTPQQPPTSWRPRDRAAAGWWMIGLAAALLASVWVARPRWHETNPRSAEIAAMPARTVTVLPFESLSDSVEDHYIAIGIADSVQHQLAGMPALHVVARASSFATSLPTLDAGAEGRRLGVHYVVRGSMQRGGNTLRVTAQLIDTQTNRALWSLKVERDVDAVFELQDEVATQVGHQLDLTLRNRPAG